VKPKRKSAKCTECPDRCFCGSSEHMEQNHLGGNNHVPWLFLPFCLPDHNEFHARCRQAGVDFKYSANKAIALIQALKAILVGMWMVVEMLEKHLKDKSEDQSNDDNQT
jgi:hypothetical protein